MSGALQAVPFWSEPEVAASIPGTLQHLEEHGVLAYPTETVYGFGGAIDSESVRKLVALKRRPDNKPFLLLISNSAMIERLGLQLSNAASMLAASFWPGPLTLVLGGGKHRVAERLRGPEGGIAVRWTPHPGLQRLISAIGDPLTSTSANLPGHPPAMTAATIVRDWEPQINRGLLRVLDGGALIASEPSTVVDCTGRSPRVIRPGAISAERLRAAVPGIVGDK